jgi:hypothetical protein
VRRNLIYTADGWIDAIVGYRSWEAWAEDGDIRLTSCVRKSFSWPKGEPVEAECRCASWYNHSCGIYAWSGAEMSECHLTPWSVMTIYQRISFQPRIGVSQILGEVELWGTVHHHERGYRAQFAHPSAFYVTQSMPEPERHFIQLASIQYGVPLILVDDSE